MNLSNLTDTSQNYGRLEGKVTGRHTEPSSYAIYHPGRWWYTLQKKLHELNTGKQRMRLIERQDQGASEDGGDPWSYAYRRPRWARS